MEFDLIDIASFAAFFIVTVGTALYKSRNESSGEDFFLASRGLIWPLIGLSLIAANISTEQFVGQAGQAAGDMGLAVGSYEWIAAITLVVVALVFLPRFLRAGIYTIPEYLEYRYNAAARAVMAFYLVVMYVGVSIASVVYSGALALETVFAMDMNAAVWMIGGIAALYATWGGLKAVAWADLFQGSALIIGGLITVLLGIDAVGGWDSFFTANADKLHTILPADHPTLPWTSMIIGIWIPNFYYWGLNQFIMQRALAAKSLKEGQLGILFAAGLKLVIPFIAVFPGIIAYQLYAAELTAPGATTDAAYPLLIRNLVPSGLRGFIFAALAGAVISSLASMLNSVSTILTVDLYKRHINPLVSPKAIVNIGRVATVVFVLLVCLIAPFLGSPAFGGIFTYIQEFQGYVSPGILGVFLFGLLARKAPAMAGVAGLLVCPLAYGFLHWQFSSMAFLNRMAVSLAVVLLTMTVMTALNPLEKPKEMPVQENFDLTPSPLVKSLGAAVVAATVALYIVFW